MVILIVAVLLQCGASAASVGPRSHLDASKTLLIGCSISPFLSQNEAESLLQYKLVLGSCFINYKILRYTSPLCPLLIATLTWIGASSLVCPITSAMTRRNSYPRRNATFQSLLPKNGETLQAIGIGDCKIAVYTANGDLVNLILHDVLYFPKARRNLFFAAVNCLKIAFS